MENNEKINGVLKITKPVYIPVYINIFMTEASRSISIEELVEECVNDSYLKLETERARAALQSGNKEEYDRIKKTMPAITPQANFTGRRRKDEPHSLSYRLFFDVDKIDNTREVVEKVKEIPSVIFACESLSGKGVHFWVEYSPIEEEDFEFCYKVVMQYLEIYLGVKLDKACCDFTRLMIINHDPQAYYNPETIPCDMTGILWLKNNNFINFNNNQEMDKQEQLSKYLDTADSNLNWTPGNRHQNLVSLVGCLNQNGFDKEDVTRECFSRYAQPGFDEKEIIKIIESVYENYASQHGTKQNFQPIQKDKWTKRQIDTLQENEEDVLDDEILYGTECPDVEEVRKYIPDWIYDYIIDPKRSKAVQFSTLMSVLVAAGAMMKGVKCMVKRDFFTTFLFYFVSGAPASGKSCIGLGHKLFNIHAERIESESDEEIRKKKEEHKAWDKCEKKCKDEDCGCGPEPNVPNPVKIDLSLNISHSKLISHLQTNGDIPTLLYTSEVESNLNIKENPITSCLRAVFEGEPVSSHTHAHGDVKQNEPKMAIIAAGTPGQWITFLKSKEDGLTSRWIGNFLPDSPYEPLGDEDDLDFNTYMDKEIAFRNRVVTFSTYVTNTDISLKLSCDGKRLFDDYFKEAEKRYAVFASAALDGFVRRSRGVCIRLAMILTAINIYDKNQGGGTYDIPDDIVKLVISWNDFWIEQHRLLLSFLPEITTQDVNEPKYAQLLKKLPCMFTLSQAFDIQKSSQEVSKRTMQRVLEKWLNKGLLRRKLQHYYKTDCEENQQTS